jgi:hypothetical protein
MTQHGCAFREADLVVRISQTKMRPAAGVSCRSYSGTQDGISVPLHLGLRDARYASPDTKREQLLGKFYRSRAETAWSGRAWRDSFVRSIGNIRADRAQK